MFVTRRGDPQQKCKKFTNIRFLRNPWRLLVRLFICMFLYIFVLSLAQIQVRGCGPTRNYSPHVVSPQVQITCRVVAYCKSQSSILAWWWMDIGQSLHLTCFSQRWPISVCVPLQSLVLVLWSCEQDRIKGGQHCIIIISVNLLWLNVWFLISILYDGDLCTIVDFEF